MKYNLFVRTCLPDSAIQSLKGAWIAPAVLDLYLTILTICKAFDFTRRPAGPALPLRVSPSKTVNVCGLQRSFTIVSSSHDRRGGIFHGAYMLYGNLN